jgi:uncharacterized membrane protein YccF (DUF307 family)
MIRERLYRTVPFGWKLIDENHLEDIPEQIEALEKAKWYIKAGYTLKSTRDWLVSVTNREITVPGMIVAIKNVRHRNPTTNEIED